jgi:hypothetical protein
MHYINTNHKQQTTHTLIEQYSLIWISVFSCNTNPIESIRSIKAWVDRLSVVSCFNKLIRFYNLGCEGI